METKFIAFIPQSSLHGVPSCFSDSTMPIKRKIQTDPEQEDEAKSEVSVELTLVHGCHDRDKKKKKKKPRARSEVCSKISRMRHYTRGEEQEERLEGVSTKLTLFLDPWKIKKKLTQSDLGHLCRLLVHTALVERHVLFFMGRDQIAEIQSTRGLRVSVWDQDTRSEHTLVLKKWATSRSHVFIDGWSQGFVNRRDLKEGDEIGLYWDPFDSRFNFRVLARVQV